MRAVILSHFLIEMFLSDDLMIHMLFPIYYFILSGFVFISCFCFNFDFTIVLHQGSGSELLGGQENAYPRDTLKLVGPLGFPLQRPGSERNAPGAQSGRMAAESRGRGGEETAQATRHQEHGRGTVQERG